MQNLNWCTWYFWEKFPQKVTFDGINKWIIINQGVTKLNVLVDIYSNWKEWISFERNARFLQALRVVGGDPLTDTINLDASFFLTNGWRLKPYPGSYTLDIEGNLAVDGGGSIFVPADPDPLFPNKPNNININTITSATVRTVTVEVSGSSSGLTPSQSLQLNRVEEMLREVWLLHELDSGSGLVVTPSIRLAGKVTQSIVQDSGSGATTVIRLP